MAERKPIRPQEGPQERFLSSSADIAIYGGAAGGGKTWALLLDPLRYVGNSEFGGVFFRRSTVQIRNEGGLWDESAKLYPLIGAAPKEHVLEWKFPGGASISFAHLEHDKTVYNYQGAQIPWIGFDELTHFSEKQFWYLLSRNRSMSGVMPCIRATCNPDADSWVARFIAWWIDQKTGLAIPERSGVIRYFVRVGDAIHWGDSPDDLAHLTQPDEDGNPQPIPPKSVTFVSASLRDNKALMAANPEYMASLMALPTVERERLLGGNWKIRPAAGMYFKREWVADNFLDAPPANLRTVRGWDLAATPKTESNDPDWTCGTKMGTDGRGNFYVLDHKADRLGPSGVEKLLKATAEADGQSVAVDLPQDPGQAGKSQVTQLTKLLVGFNVRSKPVTGDKVTRFSGFSAQAEAGNVWVVRGEWNERWLRELENFPPETGHDDDADSTAQAFNALTTEPEKNVAMMLTKRHRR
ncbi:phage terminase large subunit [Rhodovulum sp. FJ3]|uniref:phage terminase large subunit n=1 Tax=Rhodovulum sp. FJ3 TaxID=3079053 RepID=UPI00293DF61E|nr:phage terminase large subunit [Rhodovulum sp. FJ3]MDV4167803.1 phage terminase large subunit [Rhodovulum sp. FJ3]